MAKERDEPRSWQSRIVGEGNEAPSDLLANPRNWRIHPRHQQDALESVLDRVGWVQRVIVNRRTGNLVDGHLRVSLALRREEATIPVTYVDLSADEEGLVLASLDPVAGMAATDADMLDSLLRELSEADAIPEELLSTLRLTEGLDAAMARTLEDVSFKAGAGADEDLWPTIKIKVNPEAERVFVEVWGRLKGTDSEKLVALCAAAAV